MSIVDDYLEKLGLTYEELKPAERAEYQRLYSALQTKSISIEDMRTHLENMREIIEVELEKTTNSKQEDIFLKARLKNIRLEQAFLLGPEKARAAMERSIKGKIISDGGVKL